MYTDLELSRILRIKYPRLKNFLRILKIPKKDKYSRNDLEFLQKAVNRGREHLLESIRQYILEHPFSTFDEIYDNIPWQNPRRGVMEFLIADLTDQDANLAETDDDKNGVSRLFYVNEETIKMLENDGDL